MTESTAFDQQMQAAITQSGIVAALTLEDVADAVPLARCLLQSGITAMELTLRTDGAVESLRAIRAEVPQMLAGIGTVLRVDQVRQIVAAGAQFAVAPGCNPRVIQAAADAGLSFAPGIMTPTDIEVALELNCRLFKFFPAETTGGLRHLTALATPYRHLQARFIPIGGLTLENMASYLRDPLVAAIGGSWIAPPQAIRAKDWTGIAERAQAAVAAAREVRAAAKPK